MLTETMTKVKKDLDDMQRYVRRNCKSASASAGLLNIIANSKQDVEVIDSHIVRGEYLSAFSKIAGHIMPRKKDFYIRRNYDYGEFWPAALDAFREGKIENVVEMARKLRRWPEGEDEDNANDNEEHLDTKAENPDEDKKKLLNRAQDESLLHLDSYCGNKKNKEYWSQMKDDDDEHNEAIEDFLKYIEEVKC